MINEENAQLFLTSPVHSQFWKSCLDSIANVLPNPPPEFQVIKQTRKRQYLFWYYRLLYRVSANIIVFKEYYHMIHFTFYHYKFFPLIL